MNVLPLSRLYNTMSTGISWMGTGQWYWRDFSFIFYNIVDLFFPFHVTSIQCCPYTDLPWTSYIQMNGEHFNVINYFWAGSTEAWNRKWISLIQLLPFQLLFPLSAFPLPKSLYTVLTFPFRIPTSLILSFFSFPLPHSHYPFPYLLPLPTSAFHLTFPYLLPFLLPHSYINFPRLSSPAAPFCLSFAFSNLPFPVFFFLFRILYLHPSICTLTERFRSVIFLTLSFPGFSCQFILLNDALPILPGDA